MIIHSIRLKNIKSYAEGPEGNGVTVNFQAGVNRIAGKNGHGKTTLIESLGYALFLTRPEFEEHFDLTTYFLRAGKKAGEIDATFSHGGDAYRIERGLGSQNKRRSKVVQLSDGSTCAEGDEDVSRFLCRLLQFPCESSLRELFWKLVGVKQGRLTWAFDSKPGDAKKFFEPLLDVAVFRECFDGLKPAIDRFGQMCHEQEKIRAGLDERIRERSNSPEVVELMRRQVAQLEQELAALKESWKTAREKVAQLEVADEAVKTAERMSQEGRNALELAAQRCIEAAKRFQDAKGASERVAAAAPAHRAYEQAEAALKILRNRQVQQKRLENERSAAACHKVEVDGKGQAASRQAELYLTQKDALESTLAALRTRWNVATNILAENRINFEQRKLAARDAENNRACLRHFTAGLSPSLEGQGKTLGNIAALTGELAAWDPGTLTSARVREASAEEAVQNLRREVAGLRGDHKTLSAQLAQIRGGTCPFLKEQCRQFDASRVEADLQQLNAAIQSAEHNFKAAECVYRAAKVETTRLQGQEAALMEKARHLQALSQEFVDRAAGLLPEAVLVAIDSLTVWDSGIAKFPAAPKPAPDTALITLQQTHADTVVFVEQAKAWWQDADAVIHAKLTAFDDEATRRAKTEQDVVNLQTQVARCQEDMAKLGTEEKRQHEAVLRFHCESAEISKRLAALDDQLQAYALLEEEISRQEQIQVDHRTGFQQYLGSKPLAEQLAARQADLQRLQDEELVAAGASMLLESALQTAMEDFDPQALAVARKNCEEMNGAVTRHTAHLEYAKVDLQREEKRFLDWQEAWEKRDQTKREINRLQAAIELTDLARDVLKNSAPAVAQHLCTRVGAQAQQIFNRINPDPVELEWKAEPRYSLCLTPGNRRFAMLSGGEQTKLALSMTLAMIHEFSGLRFCIFDEPTYGVDADSRQKLADAILDAQDAAGLDQVLLVSHDDAFDGKIEHAILLRKTAAHGTEVVFTQ
ncbi:MAG TPA: SMC family ATPase [Chthoniobacterales bacterium]